MALAEVSEPPGVFKVLAVVSLVVEKVAFVMSVVVAGAVVLAIGFSELAATSLFSTPGKSFK